jgi:hypothetical protein
MTKTQQVNIIKALADIASQGTYQLRPTQAAEMNNVFLAVAELINFIEAEETNNDSE